MEARGVRDQWGGSGRGVAGGGEWGVGSAEEGRLVVAVPLWKVRNDSDLVLRETADYQPVIEDPGEPPHHLPPEQAGTSLVHSWARHLL